MQQQPSVNAALSPFEEDILDQPRALRTFIETPRPERFAARGVSDYDRIIVTGMGASHFAGLRTWRRLSAARLPAWWIGTAELLESFELISEGSLLIVTSQSGASGETAALLERLAENGTGAEVVGVTNDSASPLGTRADAVLELSCGEEATVSTKSYVNTLAAHECLALTLLGGERAQLEDDLADALRATADPALRVGGEFAADVLSADPPRIAIVGERDHLATALFAGLIVKEATKLPAEGFVGGAFRHGPLEIAGPGLTALFFGVDGGDRRAGLSKLADDVAATGASVVRIGDHDSAQLRIGGGLSALIRGAIVCQWFSVALGRGRGITPGEFRYGSKVTAL